MPGAKTAKPRADMTRDLAGGHGVFTGDRGLSVADQRL
jgi:hypothetical protein